MIRRRTIALLLAIALPATLTVTAFAVSLPGASAPSARDLPRIVSERPTDAATAGGAATGSAAVTPTPSASSGAPSTVATSSAGTTGAHTSSGNGSSPGSGVTGQGSHGGSGTGTSDASDSSDADDNDEREVVVPPLHEADEEQHAPDDRDD